MILTYAVAALLWLSLITYAVLGGADFGAGLWDFLAFGAHAEEHHNLIKKAIGPVWEANNVWLTYLIVGLLTGFPIVAELLSTALFIPFSLILIGIVMRGASFVFRSQITRAVALREAWGRSFSLASSIVPFLFGAGAAAVASGSLRIVHGQMPVGLIWEWLTPFAIVVGLMGVALTSTVAAVFLTVEAEWEKDAALAEAYRLRAFIAGSLMAILGAIGLYLASSEAPIIWRGMLNHAIWAIVITILLGVVLFGALWRRRYRLARVLVVLQTAGILGTWGLSQLPYIVPPDLTLTGAASPPTTMAQLFASALIGMGVLTPSLWFLFFVFKGQNVVPRIHEEEVEGL